MSVPKKQDNSPLSSQCCSTNRGGTSVLLVIFLGNVETVTVNGRTDLPPVCVVPGVFLHGDGTPHKNLFVSFFISFFFGGLVFENLSDSCSCVLDNGDISFFLSFFRSFLVGHCLEIQIY